MFKPHTLYKIVTFVFTLILLSQPLVFAQGPLNALKLDGVNDYAEFSNDNRGITNQVTVEAWIKTSSMGHHHIVSKYDRDTENGFQLLIQNGKACIAGRDGSGNYRVSGYSNVIVADNNWHHIAGVVKEGTWTIYVDGILENQAETGYQNTVLNNDEKLLLGNYYYLHLGNHFYMGLAEEVRLWNKALTAEEIRQNICKTLPANANGLVGYFKLDNIAGGVVMDHSSSRMNGRLVNTTPTLASVQSGAPIGDRSVYRYTNNWNESLEMVTDNANFSVVQVDPATQGFHLYSIQSPPTSTNGINSPQEVREYYGLFKVGDPEKKYKVYFRQNGMDCGGNLYRRSDNTVENWSQVADTTASPIMRYTSSANYGEFAATSKPAPSVKISGPTNICAGSTSTLSATIQGTGNVLWNTGETSSSIQITESGTYSVEVSNGTGCTARDEVQVSFRQEPVISLPSEAFTCYGEPVILDATTEGAVYSWSSGQTTKSISVTTPGTYVVTLTINNCSFVKEVVVSNDECPAIPNIITPNEDGKNDKFVVQGVEPNSMEIIVFNRWGKAVYQNQQYDNNWSAAALPAGTYFYHLTSRRSQKVYKGWVEVSR